MCRVCRWCIRIFTAPPLAEPVGPVAKHQAKLTAQTTTRSFKYTNSHSYFYSFAFFFRFWCIDNKLTLFEGSWSCSCHYSQRCYSEVNSAEQILRTNYISQTNATKKKRQSSHYLSYKEGMESIRNPIRKLNHCNWISRHCLRIYNIYFRFPASTRTHVESNWNHQIEILWARCICWVLKFSTSSTPLSVRHFRPSIKWAIYAGIRGCRAKE